MSPLSAYAYSLPSDLIAHTPAEPRDSARLFVYETATDTVTFATVADLPGYIAGTHLVYNDTTVLPARLFATHADGITMELLVLVDRGVTESGEVQVVLNRKKLKAGEKIFVASSYFVVIDTTDKGILLRYAAGKAALLNLLQDHGETPLPPYISSPLPEFERRTKYQTMFAKEAPSVAAPTASLHFTPTLLTSLTSAGVTTSPVTLQVGLGTFEPLYEEHFTHQKLHQERYYVPSSSATGICAARREGRKIVAVGTTVVRTLESAKEAILTPIGAYGDTDIFIRPPYTFTFPDILMTNFHVPESSLMFLVQAFIEHKGGKKHITELYALAIEARFRFYSFGDAMLIL